MNRPKLRLVSACALIVALLGGFPASTHAASATPVAPVNTADGLALKGYDPVAYFISGQPIPGLAQYNYRSDRVTYRFASADDLARFTAEPVKYRPQYGGYCAYAMALDRIADIDPKRWAIVDGKLYLNNGYIAQTLWGTNKVRHIAAADRNWPLYPKKSNAR